MATNSTANQNGSLSSPSQYSSSDVHVSNVESHDLKNQSKSPRLSDNDTTTCDSVRVCEMCGCEGRVKRLQQDVRRLERIISQRDDVIIKLRAENQQMSAELLEIQLQKLQQSISEKDSAIAVLEMQLKDGTNQTMTSLSLHSQVEELRTQRALLTQQLKVKVQERLGSFRKGSDEVLGSLAQQCQSCNKEQVCEVLRSLEHSRYKVKAYIDQLLAVVLEKCPSVLEGMPRIQQNGGMKLELLRMASLSELLEEVEEKERNSESLQSYASLLLQRIMDHSPDLLEHVSTIKHFDSDSVMSS